MHPGCHDGTHQTLTRRPSGAEYERFRCEAELTQEKLAYESDLGSKGYCRTSSMAWRFRP